MEIADLARTFETREALLGCEDKLQIGQEHNSCCLGPRNLSFLQTTYRFQNQKGIRVLYYILILILKLSLDTKKQICICSHIIRRQVEVHCDLVLPLAPPL